MGTQDASKMRDEKKSAKKKLNQIEQLKLKNATLQLFEENPTCPLTCLTRSGEELVLPVD